MKKTQLKLIEPFFTEDLDYKNDYVTYIEVGNSSSVTPKNNNIKISLKTKKNEYPHPHNNALSLV